MKALTLLQPWASLIALGHKRYETRSWRTGYRGPLAIHASASTKAADRPFIREEVAAGRVPEELPLGAVLCVVQVVACHRTEVIEPGMMELELRLGNFGYGRYAWELLGPLWIPAQPIPYRGALGLWDLPDEVLIDHGYRGAIQRAFTGGGTA